MIAAAIVLGLWIVFSKALMLEGPGCGFVMGIALFFAVAGSAIGLIFV